MKETTQMTARELDYYEAGIKDAHEVGHITVPCRSERCNALLEEDRGTSCDLVNKCLKSYGLGVAYEINRQAKLEFGKAVR